jgi:predicted nuclease with TOPRIM domain
VDALGVYQRSGKMPPAVQEALAKAVALKQAVVDTQRRVDEGKQRLADITAEQGRIRENIKTVQKNGKYYERLMAKLNDQETAIEKTQGEDDDLQKLLEAQRKELEDYVAGLNV